MPAWATVVVTLGASLIAVIGTLFGGWLQEARASSRADAEARKDRIREGADIVARVEILLSDGFPDRLGMNVRREEPFGAWQPLQDEWISGLRTRLVAFTLADQSPQVRDVGRKLNVAVTNSLISSGWMLRDIANPVEGLDGARSRQQALADHAEAVKLSTRLMALLREERGGNEGATEAAERDRDAQVDQPSESAS